MFSTRVENKKSCFVMCDVRMLLIGHAEASYDCPWKPAMTFCLKD